MALMIFIVVGLVVFVIWLIWSTKAEAEEYKDDPKYRKFRGRDK